MKTDAEIQKAVMEELKWEPFLNSSEIGVAVKNGVVTLSGTVDTFLKKSDAEKAAKRVSGVKAVAEDIEVKFGDGYFRNDSEIALAIVNALKWHSAINEEKIRVKVENGIVTLDGEVDWEYQRSSAINQIEQITGVRNIINNVSIKQGPVAKELKNKIVSAFTRRANLDANKIKVEVLGHSVTLKGSVRSWAEKTAAANAVWAAPGVTKVENQLNVETEVLAY